VLLYNIIIDVRSKFSSSRKETEYMDKQYSKWGWIAVLTVVVVAVAIVLLPVFKTVIAELYELFRILESL